MAFNVYFEIKKNRLPVGNGILVYQVTSSSQKSRALYADQLDADGQAKTDWHSDWSGEDVEVYCHTDGVNRGTPAFVSRVTLRPGARLTLHIR